jgi:Domain of unknown function (DUF3883)
MRLVDGQVRLSASDVANFLACRHLTRLDELRARGVIDPPHLYDAGFEDLVKRGEAHEKEVLQGYRDRGLQVVEIAKDTSAALADRRVGKVGEKLVVEYEQSRLQSAGRSDLAKAVRWVAEDDGDGLGYDVLSFEITGEKLHIEVKATGLAAETPFYISSAELDIAGRHPRSYAIYRVSRVDQSPQFFVLRGPDIADLDKVAVTYQARLPGASANGNYVRDDCS